MYIYIFMYNYARVQNNFNMGGHRFLASYQHKDQAEEPLEKGSTKPSNVTNSCRKI